MASIARAVPKEPSGRPPPVSSNGLREELAGPLEEADTETREARTDERAAAVRDALRRHWGFESLRAHQGEAIDAALDHRDALIVLPTGGGKSLCYQLPPLVDGALTVVVSPLISLMKDQVDGLKSMGVPAGALHSGLEPDQRADVEAALERGELRLLFVAPERLFHTGLLETLKRLGVTRFAIDEAHCISHWGHDFRPDYRELATLRDRLPGACFHALTATATPRVQADIVERLALQDPVKLVGHFDRPNLVFRVIPMVDRLRQCREIVARHEGEAAIVYCLSRKDTEAVVEALSAAGIGCEAYHAGLEPEERRRIQEDFAAERLNVVVATVAFGMGIDRSNVRLVLHATMPKSVEHYQQEAGRAGRDGLEAECVLLYSPADAQRWEALIRSSAEEAQASAAVLETQLELLAHMRHFCSGLACRHRALVAYFGQNYEAENCGACDVCLGEGEEPADATTIAQKILSCVYRTGERFGAGHVVDVLRGADTQMIRRAGHDRVSTHGLLKEHGRKQLLAWLYQLMDQGLLERRDEQRPVLRLTPAARPVLRGERAARLRAPARAAKPTRADTDAWAGVDRALAERLRSLRKRLAAERGVPPFMLFDDNTLRALSRERPTTTVELQQVRGMGEKRVRELGPALLEAIQTHESSGT